MIELFGVNVCWRWVICESLFYIRVCNFYLLEGGLFDLIVIVLKEIKVVCKYRVCVKWFSGN